MKGLKRWIECEGFEEVKDQKRIGRWNVKGLRLENLAKGCEFLQPLRKCPTKTGSAKSCEISQRLRNFATLAKFPTIFLLSSRPP